MAGWTSFGNSDSNPYRSDGDATIWMQDVKTILFDLASAINERGGAAILEFGGTYLPRQTDYTNYSLYPSLLSLQRAVLGVKPLPPAEYPASGGFPNHYAAPWTDPTYTTFFYDDPTLQFSGGSYGSAWLVLPGNAPGYARANVYHQIREVLLNYRYLKLGVDEIDLQTKYGFTYT